MELLYIPGGILIIALRLYLASVFFNIANEKGYAEKKYFWLPALLGIIGYLAVIALPDRGKKEDLPESKETKQCT